MAEIAIRADGLGKSYRIDHAAAGGYRTLRESLASAATRPLRRSSEGRHETIWALQDVSFEVQRGEALGIIGRNGAGKSTLLKILSRITRPTRGRAEVYGRLGSLLEVGTGFHPELTGRENIFLNGAILGMSRRDIQRHFDEIVAFAETEKFLDTPVKRYSSGMFMRLAFAVAAHLETDILVVDEVLAVGDTAFQAKCLGKMEDVASHGRTVLFVSHNMGAVSRLCSRAILLADGQVEVAGTPAVAIGRYLEGGIRDGRVRFDRPDHRMSVARLDWAETRNEQGRFCQDFSVGDDVSVSFGLLLTGNRPSTKLAVSLRATDGTPIAHVVDDDSSFTLDRQGGRWTVTVRFRDIRLYPGTYYASLWVMNGPNTEVLDHADDCLSFRIVDGGRLTMRSLPRHSGIIFLTPTWEAMLEEPVYAPRPNEPVA